MTFCGVIFCVLPISDMPRNSHPDAAAASAFLPRLKAIYRNLIPVV
jgi:hypothetical protein